MTLVQGQQVQGQLNSNKPGGRSDNISSGGDFKRAKVGKNLIKRDEEG